MQSAEQNTDSFCKIVSALIIYVGMVPFFFSVFCSCSTMPPSAAPVPEWVHKAPPSDALYEYFTATGTGCGAEAEQLARKQALNSVLTELGRYLGTSVTVTVQTAGKSGTDTNLLNTQLHVQASAQAYIEQCKIIETFIHPQEQDSRCISVSLLVRYDKAALAAEQLRLEALNREKEAAIQVPEQEADAYAAAGKPDKALLRYIEAARAAANSETDNAAVRYERNIGNARDMLSRIKMKRLSADQLTASVKHPFPSSFDVQLYTGTDSGSIGLADMPVVISYTERHPKTGRKTIPIRKMRSRGDGRISFIHPPQPYPYTKGMAAIALDIDTLLLPLRTVPHRYKPLLRLLEDAAHPCRITFVYDVKDTAAPE